MDALRLCGDLPRQRALIGIEPGDIDWGTEPTEAVAAAVPLASMRIRELIGEWRKQAAREAAA
jgi:hydrogenase maturation protease